MADILSGARIEYIFMNEIHLFQLKIFQGLISKVILKTRIQFYQVMVRRRRAI